MNGSEIIPDSPDVQKVLAGKMAQVPSKEEARKQTIAYGILKQHNTSGSMEKASLVP